MHAHAHGAGSQFIVFVLHTTCTCAFAGIYLDAGSTTCAGFPGSLGHEAADVAWIASIGADYLWLDGCNLDGALMEEKYELWSTLLNQSGREIPWEVMQTLRSRCSPPSCQCT